MRQRILIADDDDGILTALEMLLKSEGFEPTCVSSPKILISSIQQQDFDLILMDLNYSLDTTSGEEGLRLIAAIRELDDIIPVVVMTGWGTIEVAVNAMKRGANDFIQKPWEIDRLLSIIKNQTELAASRKNYQKLSQQNKLLEKAVRPDNHIVSASENTKRILSTLEQVSQSDVNVLLTGENGVGKSLFARYLHNLSARKEEPLISVNMGALPESLFESEMFGHVKGAFTGAQSNRIGRFELADQGSLFLDEIANTPYSQQGKLLRVLEESQFEKVGSSKTQTVDIRLITATNSDLEKAVDEGHFRKDLLYRINTIEIEIPPLRRRVEDIIPLANEFIKNVAKKYSKTIFPISKEAESSLKSYSWPGNVRELNHVIERAYILCQTEILKAEDLMLNTNVQDAQKNITDFERDYDSKNKGSAIDLRPIKDIEIDILQQRLAYFNGNALDAAESLGMSRSTFYRQLNKHK